MADCGCIRRRTSKVAAAEKRVYNRGSIVLPADYLRKRVAKIGGNPVRKKSVSSAPVSYTHLTLPTILRV